MLLEYVFPITALSLAIFNVLFIAYSRRQRRRLTEETRRRFEESNLRADRQLEQARGPGNEGAVTSARRKATP